jgi:hypothetical protein
MMSIIVPIIILAITKEMHDTITYIASFLAIRVFSFISQIILIKIMWHLSSAIN